VNHQVSALDLASVHNSIVHLTQVYGQLLAEQERRQQMLTAQLKAAQDEVTGLRKRLEELAHSGSQR